MSGRGVAVVTGGASGIGEAAARRFAAADYRVAVLDIDAERGEASADTIRSDGGSARFWQIDVTDAEAVDAVGASVVAEFGQVDALVNSGGILQNATRVLDMPLTEAERILKVNYLGTVACCQVFGRVMRAQRRGSIINLASINSFR